MYAIAYTFYGSQTKSTLLFENLRCYYVYFKQEIEFQGDLFSFPHKSQK